MAAKLIFIFILCIAFISLIQAAEVEPEKKPNEKSASETIEDAFNSFKSSVDEIVTKVKNNELVQNATKTLEEWGESAKKTSQDLFDKLKQQTQ